MRTTEQHHATTRRSDDTGFTLVELLIVIVILGILATVTVFAVRGITDQGEENAEAAELRTLETAVEAYWSQNGANPVDEAALVTGGYLREESGLFTYADNGDGTYTITNDRTGTVANGGGSGGTPPAPPAPPANVVWLGTPTPLAGFTVYQQGPGSDATLLIGGDDAHAIWQADFGAGQSINPNPAFPETLYAIHPDHITDYAALQSLISAASGQGWDVLIVDGPSASDWCNVGGIDYYFGQCVNEAGVNPSYLGAGSLESLWLI